MGVSVVGLRYGAVVVGGSLAGLAGAYLSLARTPGWSEGMTAGRGWIAVGLVIFARWNPIGALAGGFLFGLMEALNFQAQAVGITLSPFFLGMLPYLFTIAQWLESDSIDPTRFPKVYDHRNRMSERPAVQRAIAREEA